MHSVLQFFGPKTTVPIVVLICAIGSIAAWHYVVLSISVIKHVLRESRDEENIP